MRPEEQNEKAESFRENLWNERQLEGPYSTEVDTRTEFKSKMKKEWASSVVLYKKKFKKTLTATSPHVKLSPWGHRTG